MLCEGEMRASKQRRKCGFWANHLSRMCAAVGQHAAGSRQCGATVAEFEQHIGAKMMWLRSAQVWSES